MRLVKLTLENLFQHRQITAEFHPGLNAILGPNGSGKSSLLWGGRGALRGQFSGDRRSQDQIICQLAGAKEPAGVILEMEHQGQTATLERRLRPARCRLHLEGEQVDGARKVEERLRAWLGPAWQAVNDYSFVAQGELFSCLSASAAERLAALQKLLGLTAALEAYHELSEQLRQELPEDKSGELKLLQNLLEQRQVELQNWEHELQELEQGTSRSWSLSSLQKQAEQERERERLLQEREHWSKRFDFLRVQERGAQEDLENCSQGWQRAEQARQALVPLPDEGQRQQELSALRLAEQEQQQRVRWQQELQRLTAAEPAAPPAQPDPLNLQQNPAAWQEAQELLVNLQVQLQSCQKLVRSFDPSTGRVACPECGTPVANLVEHLAQERARLPELTEHVRWLTETLRHAEQVREAQRVYQQRREHWETSYQHAQRSLESVPWRPPGEATYQQRMQYYQEQVRLHWAAERECSAMELNKQSAQDALQRLQEEMRHVQDRIQALPEGAPGAGQLAQEAYHAAQARQRLLLEQAGRAQQGLQELHGQLAQLQAHQDRQATHVSWRERAQAMRESVHPDKLQKSILQPRLAGLGQRLNQLLEEFDGGFQVTVGEQLELQARFPDGRCHPADWLSGGQQTVLALAYRLAVVERFVQDAGLLVLDEPTAWLSESSLAAVERALVRLRALAGSRGLQVIVVTHQRKLAAAFDHLIELGG